MGLIKTFLAGRTVAAPAAADEFTRLDAVSGNTEASTWTQMKDDVLTDVASQYAPLGGPDTLLIPPSAFSVRSGAVVVPATGNLVGYPYLRMNNANELYYTWCRVPDEWDTATLNAELVIVTAGAGGNLRFSIGVESLADSPSTSIALASVASEQSVVAEWTVETRVTFSTASFTVPATKQVRIFVARIGSDGTDTSTAIAGCLYAYLERVTP